MSPPSAGLDPPGRRSRATSTRISQVPRSRHTAAVMGVVVAAARTHPRRISHQSLAGASRLVDTEVRARTGRKMRGIYAG